MLAWLFVLLRFHRRRARSRLLLATVGCAEEAGFHHWIDAETLVDWVRNGDTDRACHHLSVVSEWRPHWDAFADLLRRRGMGWDSGTLRVTEGRNAVQVHRLVPSGTFLVDLTPGDAFPPIPLWMVGPDSTRLRWWVRPWGPLRVPVHEESVAAWRRSRTLVVG